jgi:hypothetical protein
MFINIPRPPIPPVSLKVYAPNGDTREVRGWIGIRVNSRNTKKLELVLVLPDESTEVLNKKVVIVDTATDNVLYTPRLAPTEMNGGEFMPRGIVRWLQENPQWPAILELEDQPVEGDGNDGLLEGR